jgi:hypothetical protein
MNVSWQTKKTRAPLLIPESPGFFFLDLGSLVFASCPYRSHSKDFAHVWLEPEYGFKYRVL